MELIELLKGAKQGKAVIEFLEDTSYDDQIEIDVPNDTYKIIYHVDDKYYIPSEKMSHSEMYKFTLNNLIHPDDRPSFRELCNPYTLLSRISKANAGILTGEYRYRGKNGTYRWTEEIIIGGTQYGFPEGVVKVFLFDIQNQKLRHSNVQFTGYSFDERDKFTGLLTRNSFYSASEEMLKIPGGSEGWCFVSIDIEHFKLFNSWYGRKIGRGLLKQIAAVIGNSAEEKGGVAGYMGDDDFIMLTQFNMQRIKTLYDRIHQLIAQYGTSIGFLPAFGISHVEAGVSVFDLVDMAAFATSTVKGNFHNRICIYDHAMRDQTEKEYKLLSNFQKALSKKEILFHLQPQCRMSTSNIVGAEALARWKTSEGSMIPPGVFVPVLEKYGFITELDKYIWEEVCVWLSNLIKEGRNPVPVSVNVSQIDILSLNVSEFIENLVKKYSLPSKYLKIEITESAYASNSDLVNKAVQELRENGFLVLMDDFGSGYSSLNMLKNLKLDVVKLDGQFLRNGEKSDTDKGLRILESIVNMTKTMSIPIMVEGVENLEQAKFLINLGCRYAQGYYYYRPMPVSDFEKLLSDESKIDRRGFIFKANQQFSVREFMDFNVYTDSMLNNILGATAFYSWDEEDNVDIVRFNQQFYKLVGESDEFGERIKGIQNYIHPQDKENFIELFKKAENDINGATGVIGVYRSNGELGRFRLRLYFLEKNNSGKVFYGSMQEITSETMLQKQMEILSKSLYESIVFVKRQKKENINTLNNKFLVVVHGLKDIMGITVEEFEWELNNDIFYRRIEGSSVSKKLREIINNPGIKINKSNIAFKMMNSDGKSIKLYMRTDSVNDEYTETEFILIFQLREER